MKKYFFLLFVSIAFVGASCAKTTTIENTNVSAQKNSNETVNTVNANVADTVEELDTNADDLSEQVDERRAYPENILVSNRERVWIATPTATEMKFDENYFSYTDSKTGKLYVRRADATSDVYYPEGTDGQSISETLEEKIEADLAAGYPKSITISDYTTNTTVQPKLHEWVYLITDSTPTVYCQPEGTTTIYIDGDGDGIWHVEGTDGPVSAEEEEKIQKAIEESEKK